MGVGGAGGERTRETNFFPWPSQNELSLMGGAQEGWASKESQLQFPASPVHGSQGEVQKQNCSMERSQSGRWLLNQGVSNVTSLMNLSHFHMVKRSRHGEFQSRTLRFLVPKW